MGNQLANTAAFHLEDPHRVPACQGLVGESVSEREGAEIDLVVPALADTLHRVIEQRQGLKPEEVKLDQADCVYVRASILGQHAPLFVDKQREMLDQGRGRNDDAGRMLGGVAQQPFELERIIEELFLPLPALAHLAQPRLHFQGRLQRKVFPLFGSRVELGDAICVAIRELQHSSHILDRLLAFQGPKGDDLRNSVSAILLFDVADDLVPPLHAEVHVDVWHALAARVEEPLEEQLVTNGIDVGDLERVGHQAAGRRAPARANRDAL